VSAKAKINTAILVIFCVIGGLFFIGESGFSILSGLRAYVGGEGMWEKGQKEATYQLSQYIFTEDNVRYQSFLDSLKVSLGDSVARRELEKSTPVYEIVFQGFIDGGIHPEDIPTIIAMFKKFQRTVHVSNAVEQREVRDRLIEELSMVGEEIQTHIVNNTMSQERAALSLSKIDSLQNRFSEVDALISHNMSKAARRAANQLFIIILIFFVTGSIVCLIMLRLISRIISDMNNKAAQLEIQVEKEKILRKELIEKEKKFRAIADTTPLAIYMSEGVEQKAVYINPTFSKLFGYTYDEVPTVDHWWPLAYPDENYRKEVSEEWQKRVKHAIDTKSDIEPMEVVVTCKDGTHKNISWGFITIGKENWACGLDLTERKQADAERERLIAELQQALSEIKTLRGILPICSYCKNIRNDEGYFEQIESYIHKHSGVDFSHTICLSCLKKHHPEEYKAISKKEKYKHFR
jgi:PAS domain S-box-containing protein